MAKIKSVNELKAEAEKVLQEARKKQAVLLKEAKEIENRNLALLGEKVVDYFHKKSTIEDVKKLAFEMGLVTEKQDKMNADSTKDIEVKDE